MLTLYQPEMIDHPKQSCAAYLFDSSEQSEQSKVASYD